MIYIHNRYLHTHISWAIFACIFKTWCMCLYIKHDIYVCIKTWDVYVCMYLFIYESLIVCQMTSTVLKPVK